MPVVTLPLTFSNSFWTQDYRHGLEHLYGKLQQGVGENAEIIAFIKARITAERGIASTLTNPALTGSRGAGFGADDGASLLMAFRGLQRESSLQGEAHSTVAKDLETLVLEPFEDWAAGHGHRVAESRQYLLDSAVKSYEYASGDVAKLKQLYITRTRAADEAEDDIKFAPNSGKDDKFTASPTGAINRHASVTDRIQQRLREKMGSAPLAEVKEDEEEQELPSPPRFTTEEKGKMKELPVDTETPSRQSTVVVPLTPATRRNNEPILLAGIALPPVAVSALLARARAELPMQTVKIPILGDYEECFTGEDITKWLRENVEAFGGSLDRAEDAARDLGERLGVWRRVGAIGNKFEPIKTAFYQFRPKAFMLSEEPEGDSVVSPTLTSGASNLMKRSGTVASYISSAFGQPNDRFQTLRAEADKADHAYATAVRNLEKQRLDLEERIEHGLKIIQGWEIERLRAIKTVLLQYQGTLATLSQGLQTSFDRSSTLVASYKPEADLTAMIERYRTGPFRPSAHVYESIAHVGPGSVSFGIDLGNWAGEGGWNALRGSDDENKSKPPVPGVLTGLLAGLEEAYGRLPSDDERRKTWIYDVPLRSIHQLRDSLIRFLPDDAPPLDLLARFDAPVLAGTVKLWLLELNPPLGSWEGWDDIRKIYPNVGATEQEAVNDHTDELKQALGHLPKVYLQTLDALIRHLRNLIVNTETAEADDVYKTKLALTLGRSILRPKHENELSIQDRHPTLFFIDVLDHYAELLPPVIAKKQRESVIRAMPMRKRTAPIDQRLSRSSMTGSEDVQKLLAAQLNMRNPRSRPSSPVRGDHPPISWAAGEEEDPKIKPGETHEHPEEPTTAKELEHEPIHEELDLTLHIAAPIISIEQPSPAVGPREIDNELPAPVVETTHETAPAVVPALDDEDQPISRGSSGLTRNTSGELSRRGVRARGPRVAGGRRMVSSEQVPSSEAAHPHGPIDANEYVPRKKGGRGAAGLFAKRDGKGGMSGDEGEESG
ncbi:hypothetical protein DACRYDRAFT_64483 [Dacryopinax primogenitus]|uniref:Rho-GAP domain-containing protein n=1 Tax=Dacryopinax primogenitus (strain DJM 731) TaxID=1858805 RepID=M5FZV7_DACPD|nr:uncharacterized protein DACRYDRAFT_64483 [Dacryopinax primogenitus]EJU03551.1 hypothetical protein DACRYDRAFT_64483 [Dacryopinax primogenitus]